MISNEMRVLENAIGSQLQDIRLKSEVDDKVLEERIQFAVDKIYSRLKTQIDE
jgi:hypothetical protein